MQNLRSVYRKLTVNLSISAAIDEEQRYLDRLESKIRRPSVSSVDAEEISEHMDVSCSLKNSICFLLQKLNRIG